MAKKLFVGGLSWNTTDDSLRRAFEAFGDVDEAKVVTDRETGRSRGFGFVTMQDGDAATTAIGKMDGANLDGRAIRVNEAEDRPRTGGGGGGGRGGFGGGPPGGGGRGGFDERPRIDEGAGRRRKDYDPRDHLDHGDDDD